MSSIAGSDQGGQSKSAKTLCPSPLQQLPGETLLDFYKRRSDAAIAAQKLIPKTPPKPRISNSPPDSAMYDFFDANGFPIHCPFAELEIPFTALNAEINTAFQGAVRTLDLKSTQFLRKKAAYDFLTNVYYAEKRRLYFVQRHHELQKERMDRMEAEIAELKARLSGGDGGGVVQGGGNDTACEMVDDAKNKAVDLNVEDDVHVTVAQSTIAVNDKQDNDCRSNKAAASPASKTKSGKGRKKKDSNVAKSGEGRKKKDCDKNNNTDNDMADTNVESSTENVNQKNTDSVMIDEDTKIAAVDLDVDPVASLGEQWLIRFNELVEYKAKHGDCKVSACDTPNKKLGKWVGQMRRDFKNGRLREERIARLNDIGFAWSMPKGPRYLNSQPRTREQRTPGRKTPRQKIKTPRSDAAWTAWYEKLLAYKEIHGHCNVSRCDKLNQKLGYWVRQVRVQYRKEELSVDRIAMLNQLGFVWRINKRIDWMSYYDELVQYKEQHGNCNVPQDYKLNKGLGEWVHNNRNAFRDGKLSEQRVKMLNELDFTWKTKTQVDWKTRYAELVQFKEEYGNCNVSTHDKVYWQLGKWVDRMRNEYKNGRLPVDRINMLNDIGFVWSIR